MNLRKEYDFGHKLDHQKNDIKQRCMSSGIINKTLLNAHQTFGIDNFIVFLYFR